MEELYKLQDVFDFGLDQGSKAKAKADRFEVVGCGCTLGRLGMSYEEAPGILAASAEGVNEADGLACGAGVRLACQVPRDHVLLAGVIVIMKKYILLVIFSVA